MGVAQAERTQTQSRQEQEEAVIAFLRDLLDRVGTGEPLPSVPSVFTDACEALFDRAQAPSAAKKDVESLLQIIRRAPKHKAFDNLLKRRHDDLPESKPFSIPIPDIPAKELTDYIKDQEYGDGLLFGRVFNGIACYDHNKQSWYIWQGHYWEQDKTGDIKTLISGYLGAVYVKAISPINIQIAELQKDLEALQEKSMVGKDEAEAKKIDSLKDKIKELKGQIETYNGRVRQLRKAKYRKNVEDYAMSDPSIKVTGEVWDRNPWLLGTPGGIIDLKTGILRDGQPSDYIRSTIPITWTGLYTPCPRFERFLCEIFELLPEEPLKAIANAIAREDRARKDWEKMTNEERVMFQSVHREELISFLHRLFGYAITGRSSEAIFPIFYGEEGRNGKDTLFKIISFVLGVAIAGVVSKDVIVARSDKFKTSGAATPHISALQGLRIAYVNETKQGDVVNIAQVKDLTGNGKQTTRDPYGKGFYSFDPSHTLFLMTNHKPHADAEDKAFWTRACLIEFCMRFVDDPDPNVPNERKKDPYLDDTLKNEASGILAWLVRGCLEYQKHELKRTNIVKRLTQAYQQGEDDIQFFIDARCFTGKLEYRAKADELYKAYRDYCTENFFKPINNKLFSDKMSKRYKPHRFNIGVSYLGISLTEE